MHYNECNEYLDYLLAAYLEDVELQGGRVLFCYYQSIDTIVDFFQHARLNFMNSKYDIPDYDKYNCLKMNAEMWFVVFFLMRPYLVLLASIANRKDRMLLINMFYEDRIPMSLSAFAAIPTLYVLYAWIKRKPDGSSAARWAWSRGRYLLASSAFLNGVAAFLPVLMGVSYKINLLAWVQFGISILIIVYLYMSQRVKDTFADFPDESEGG